MGFTVSVNYHDTISYGSRQPKKQVKQWWGPPVYEVPKTKPEDLTELQSNFATEYRIFKQLDADENGVLSKEELWDKLARWEEGVANKVYAMVDANDDEEVDFYEFLTACKKSDIVGHMALGGYLL